MKAAELFPFRHEVRAGTLKAVRELPAEHLAWKPEGGVHSIMDWLRHLAQTEDWWIQACVLGRKDFAAKRTGLMSDLTEVLQYLEGTRNNTEQLLLEWPASVLQESRVVGVRSLRSGARSRELSLHWIIANIFDHERHHRAQIYLYLRLMGLEPPPS